jgi:hypothetical protein
LGIYGSGFMEYPSSDPDQAFSDLEPSYFFHVRKLKPEKTEEAVNNSAKSRVRVNKKYRGFDRFKRRAMDRQ